MTLERWLSLALLAACLAYGYTAFFVMDAQLPRFAKLSPIWPSSFPKVIASLALIIAFLQLMQPKQADTVQWKSLKSLNWTLALVICALMVAYALLLRPMGFLLATYGFLTLTAFALGERKLMKLSVIAVITAGALWYLVDQVLGIYLRPLPWFIGWGG